MDVMWKEVLPSPDVSCPHPLPLFLLVQEKDKLAAAEDKS